MFWKIRTDGLVTPFSSSTISENYIARQLSSASLQQWANSKRPIDQSERTFYPIYVNTIGSCLACVRRVMDACGKLGMKDQSSVRSQKVGKLDRTSAVVSKRAPMGK